MTMWLKYISTYNLIIDSWYTLKSPVLAHSIAEKYNDLGKKKQTYNF